MKKSLLLFNLLFFSVLQAQVIFEQQLHNPDCYEEGYSLIFFNNQNILLSGAYNCTGTPNDWNSHFVRFNVIGDTIETIQNLPYNGLASKGIQENFFLAGGNTAGFVYDSVKIWNINENGQIIWDKSFVFPLCNHQATAIEATPDGGVIFTVIYSVTDCSNPAYNTAIVKLDDQGNQQWREDITGQANDQLHAIKFYNNAFYFSGWSNSVNTGANNHVLLLKSDLNGNILWSTDFDLFQNSFGYGLEIVPDDGIYIAGYHSESFVLKADLDGQFETLTAYGNACGGRNYKINHTADNKLVFLSREIISGNCFAFFTKTDLSGDVIWRLNRDAILRDFVFINDSSFVLAGNRSHLPDIYLLRFDSTFIASDTLESSVFNTTQNLDELKVEYNNLTQHFQLTNYHPKFEGSNFSLYNLSGQLVLKNVIQGNVINSHNLLPPGIYFYQLNRQNRIVKKGSVRVY